MWKSFGLIAVAILSGVVNGFGAQRCPKYISQPRPKTVAANQPKDVRPYFRRSASVFFVTTPRMALVKSAKSRVASKWERLIFTVS